MAQVYYNYEKTSIDISKSALSGAINAKNAAPITNLKYNDEAYFLQRMYFYKPTGFNSTYLVLEHISDPNGNSGKTLYLAAKLAFNGKESDLDKLIAAGENSSRIEYTLNDSLTDGGDAFVATDDRSRTITIVLRNELELKARTMPDGTTIYTNVISGLSFPDGNDVTNSNKNATIRKSILDWSISCELEGEDMDNQTAVATKSETSNLIDNINMIAMFVLVVGAASLGAPEIYRRAIVPIFESYGQSTGPKPISSLNFFWRIFIGLLCFELFIFGVSGKGSSFYLMAGGLAAILFSVEKSLYDHFSDGKQFSQVDVINVPGTTGALANDQKYGSFVWGTDHLWNLFPQLYCIMSMLGIWGANFNVMGNDTLTEHQMLMQVLTTYPNYFLYAITFTLFGNTDTGGTWFVIKIIAILLSTGYFVGSIFAVAKNSK